MNNAISIDQKTESHFKKGLKIGIPVSIGYIPIAIAFGLLAKSAQVPDIVTLMMSLMIFAGASQFIGINLMAAGVAYWEIVFTTFLLNVRHFLMTASLSQRLPKKTSKKVLAILSFGVTDETFSVASTQQEKELRPTFLLGLNSITFVSWNIGTWIGVFIAVGLPTSIQSSMGIALYSMFIGLLVPSLKKSKETIVVVSIALFVSSLFYWVVPYVIQLSSGMQIICTTVIAASIGALMFPKEEMK
ncbi:AzlC family ABC transporter permease [Alkalihalobacillus hemicellulosilyticus]|uniref:Branched-chain amino acid transporter n=1 Tax=Halalkalibacter hemicellulosilyticusJCM 9152 TaxID=1236971 RepID=W4QFU3_9BACI|nr:AzlC family ABC transporter permease [Halalkalibacter hemicellulosilyticus]GAE30518.1 branched-chain amino acid transporter [Halalkalibacter hemicellulosilyticusJCM 9152]